MSTVPGQAKLLLDRAITHMLPALAARPVLPRRWVTSAWTREKASENDCEKLFQRVPHHGYR